MADFVFALSNIVHFSVNVHFYYETEQDMEYKLPLSEIQSSISAAKCLSEMQSVMIIIKHYWKMS
jgi:hypothetical protein